MAFSEKIKLIFDIDDAPGVKSLKNLKKGVSDAEGAFGKFKAGASGSMGLVKENAAALGTAGAASLVAFGVHAVGVFTDTAKAALDLGTATGLSVEQASKWIAVGDDFQVSASDIQTGLGKISKTLDDTKWDKYGISTRDAGGQARSTNDILLDSFDALGKITNETERAKAGNELFGKGYASLAPMIGKTKDEYKAMLDQVSDGQTITTEEAEKAEKMRLAQDKLSDAIQDVTLVVGEFVASLAPLISVLADAIEWVAGLQEKTEDLALSIMGLDDPVYAVGENFSKTSDQVKQASGHMADFSDAALTAADSSRVAKAEVAYLNEALVALNGHLDQREAARTFEEAMYVFRSEVGHSEESTDTYIGKLRDATVALDSIPTDVQTKMIAALDQGSYEFVESRLSFLARNRNSVISSQIVGADFNNAREGRAAGGPVLPGEAYTVGEHGIEVLQMGATGGRVIPNHALGGVVEEHFHFHGPVLGEQDFINRLYDGFIDGQRRGVLAGVG